MHSNTTNSPYCQTNTASARYCSADPGTLQHHSTAQSKSKLGSSNSYVALPVIVTLQQMKGLCCCHTLPPVLPATSQPAKATQHVLPVTQLFKYFRRMRHLPLQQPQQAQLQHQLAVQLPQQQVVQQTLPQPAPQFGHCCQPLLLLLQRPALPHPLQ